MLQLVSVFESALPSVGIPLPCWDLQPLLVERALRAHYAHFATSTHPTSTWNADKMVTPPFHPQSVPILSCLPLQAFHCNLLETEEAGVPAWARCWTRQTATSCAHLQHFVIVLQQQQNIVCFHLVDPRRNGQACRKGPPCLWPCL